MMKIKPNQQQNKIASPGGIDAIQTSFTFLPMLCSSSSTKQVKLSHRRCSSASTSTSTISDDPSSPKVGCMGQVKRNNKVVGFPTIISFTNSTTSNNSSNNSSTHHHVIKCHESNNYTSNNIVKYYKLKKFFSTKSHASSQKGKTGIKHVVCRSKGDEKGSLVNIVDMDPPLPVVKKVVQQGNNDGENMSTLWKRRSGGAPLECLRVQVIHQNLILLPANTV